MTSDSAPDGGAAVRGIECQHNAEMRVALPGPAAGTEAMVPNPAPDGTRNDGYRRPGGGKNCQMMQGGAVEHVRGTSAYPFANRRLKQR